MAKKKIKAPNRAYFPDKGKGSGAKLKWDATKEWFGNLKRKIIGGNTEKDVLVDKMKDASAVSVVKYAHLMHGMDRNGIKKQFKLDKQQSQAVDRYFKENKKNLTSLGVLKNGKVDATVMNANVINGLIDDYIAKYSKRLKPDQQLHLQQIKKNVSLKGTKALRFNELLDDYKHNKISLNKLSKKTKMDRVAIVQILARESQVRSEMNKKRRWSPMWSSVLPVH